MDDFILLDDADRPRHLPPQLRSRLEEVLLSRAETDITELQDLDRPRVLPPMLRRRLLRSMVKRPRWGMPTVTTLAGAAAAMILMVGAAVLLLPGSREPDGPDGTQRPAPIALASPEPDASLPSASPAPQEQPRRSERPAPKITRDTSPPSFSRSRHVSSRSEVCFPEERCPVVHAMPASASDGGGDGDAGAPLPPAVPPGKPRDVRAQTGPSLGEITITWEAPADVGSSPIRKYALYRTREGEPGMTTVAILDASVRSYVDTGLSLGTYTYKLRVRNHDAISDYSDGSSAFAISAN